ncbi:universal stress protein [Jannaschia sp. Os4]|uniref:universal stress protein n=1 Tax=Jannaschia sp. Os4 TaxID=2807617 RepID=UPI001939AED2|nr:universal stress protein [Jannaschia sp. Os4]MBM2578105.1 universal stress protein [Jannaschia sp. Os4]
MTPKTVFACLTDEAPAPALCRAAATLAAGWDAHLTGLHVKEGLTVSPSFRVELPRSVYAMIDETQSAHADRLQAAFEAASGGLGARAEWRCVSADGDLESDRMVEAVRAADLVCMSAATGTGTFQQRFLHEAVIRQAGRPVLVVPEAAEVAGLSRAVVGWRDTAQATRALHDLLPLLAPGASVKLVAFEEGRRLGDAGDAMTDLAAALSRHGFAAEAARRTDRVDSVSAALEGEARAFGADVLAVGAYGHSRLYDLVLGAVSRDLLRETHLPVLFSR